MPASSTDSADPPGDKHTRFTTWAQARGVAIQGVQAQHLPGRGHGLITTQPIRAGDRILFIPPKAMFHADPALRRAHPSLRDASPHAHLALSALQAFPSAPPPPPDVDAAGLALWRSTWPSPAAFARCMPLHWPARALACVPPAVRAPLERQRADYARDWQVARPVCEARGWGEAEFAYVWMLVNSRSFYWKAPRAAGGGMVLCPFVDYMNHVPSEGGCGMVKTDRGYEVVADRAYDVGEEILATYGAHSNDKLLVHYGFVVPHVPDGHSADDDIRLDHLLLPRLSEQTRAQLADVGYLGGYSLLPAANELCFKTQVAVRAELLTCNEWEFFVGMGEDMTVDHTGEVERFVRGILSEYRDEAVEWIRESRKLEIEVQRNLLVLRWQQIVDAIDRFCKPPCS